MLFAAAVLAALSLWWVAFAPPPGGPEAGLLVERAYPSETTIDGQPMTVVAVREAVPGFRILVLSDGGQPLSGVSAVRDGGDVVASSGTDGVVELPAAGPVLLEAPGFLPELCDVSAPSIDPLRVELKQSVKCRVLVYGIWGAPMDAVRLTVETRNYPSAQRISFGGRDLVRNPTTGLLLPSRQECDSVAGLAVVDLMSAGEFVVTATKWGWMQSWENQRGESISMPMPVEVTQTAGSVELGVVMKPLLVAAVAAVGQDVSQRYVAQFMSIGWDDLPGTAVVQSLVSEWHGAQAHVLAKLRDAGFGDAVYVSVVAGESALDLDSPRQVEVGLQVAGQAPESLLVRFELLDRWTEQDVTVQEVLGLPAPVPFDVQAGCEPQMSSLDIEGLSFVADERRGDTYAFHLPPGRYAIRPKSAMLLGPQAYGEAHVPAEGEHLSVDWPLAWLEVNLGDQSLAAKWISLKSSTGVVRYGPDHLRAGVRIPLLEGLLEVEVLDHALRRVDYQQVSLTARAVRVLDLK